MAVMWRLARAEYSDDLEGKGNIGSGSRWNSPGRGVVYGSFNLSLCVLEAFVHLPARLRMALPQMIAIQLELPDGATHRAVTLGDLPTDLESEETERLCRQVGDTWLKTSEHLVLTAPSLVVRQEANVMINPVHPLMRRVKVLSKEIFHFDPRLSAPR
jgi:RES domain-containing protein